MQATDPHHKIVTYGLQSATSTYRTHLISVHLEEWTATCKKHGIAIKSKCAQRAVDGIQPGSAGGDTSEPYSNEAFVDAIVEFIVGDDLVCSIVLALLFSLTISFTVTQYCRITMATMYLQDAQS